MSSSKIIQIIPAVNWFAVYASESESILDDYECEPLICWALQEDGEIVGIIADERYLMDAAASNLLGFTRIKDDSDFHLTVHDWSAAATAYRDKKK
jgi:hypothetical protein